MENYKVPLRSSELSLKGVTDDGKKYEISGEVEEVSIEVFSDYEDTDIWLSYSKPHLIEETYWLKFKRKENGEAYRIQMETVDILREAWMSIDENSFKAVAAARALCGAPEDATVYVNESYVGFGVKFTWTEKVVK